MTKLTTALFTQLKSDLQTDLDALWNYAAIGEGSTTPSPSDTELVSEVLRDAVDSTSTSTPGEFEVNFIVGAGEAVGNTIQEAGLFSSNFSQVDACDATTGWTDSADMTVSLNNTTFYQGSGSLNLTKDGTSSTTAYTEKTTTSVNFTSQKLSIQLYILDSTTLNKLAATSGLSIRFGSDSSNYYRWDIDRSELAVGKNFIDGLTSSNADSTTGSPSLTAMTYFRITFTTTGSSDTWSAGSILMDDLKVIGGTCYLRDTLTAISKLDSITLYLDYIVTITVTET